MRYHLDDGDA